MTWMQITNPETGKTGKDLENYRIEHDLSVKDVTIKTGVSESYLKAVERHNKPIKQNMYDRLKGYNAKGKKVFPGLRGF